jgi:hypothetical protein
MSIYIGQRASLLCATVNLALGLQSMIKFIAWKAAALEIDFIYAAPDLFTTRCVVYGRII